MSTAVFDKATELIAPGAAITSTASGTGVQLNPRYFETCDWVLYASAVLGTGTYTFTLEVSDVVGGTYTAVARYVWPPAQAAGKVHIPIQGQVVASLDNDSKFVRVTATLGATSSIVYGSYLTKASNNAGLGIRQGDIVSVF